MSLSLISNLASSAASALGLPGPSSGPTWALKNKKTDQYVLKNIMPVRVNIKMTSTPLRHMKEDGTTIVDARVIQPTTVMVDCFCPDISTFVAANAMRKDREALYSMLSKGVILRQLMCNSEQIKQSPEVMSAMRMRMSFQQVITKDLKPVIVFLPTNSSLVSLGMTLLSSAASTVSGLVSTVKKAF